MKDKVGAVVTRAAESWQFFAFIFAAVAAIGLSLIEELHVALGWRIGAKLIYFLLCFYTFMVNVRMRNKLARFLGWIKTEKH